MSVQIRDVDNGAKGLIDRLFKLGKPRVAVGVFESDGAASAGEGVTVIEVATINEFGGGNVPPRSWLRAWFDENQEKARELLSRLMASAAKGKITKEQALERFGLWCQGQIQKRIAQGIPPANASSTVRKKGSDKPLIDTGQFRTSITYAIGYGDGGLTPKASRAAVKRQNDAKKQARKARKAKLRNAKKAVKRVVRRVKKAIR
jgi:hypothetical protein